jgi:diadenosine tetraphosphate (Ap4A) HIT family hydrolase
MLESVLKKFNYPSSLVKEYDNWYWLIRSKQLTLGSSIIISKHNIENYSDLELKSFIELKEVVSEVESKLKKFTNYKKINYLMLMMEDPVVHYHVIPRYEEELTFFNKTYKDFGYPSLPDFKNYIELTQNEMQEIIKIIKK